MRKGLLAALAVLVVLGLGAAAGWYWGRPIGADAPAVIGQSGTRAVPPAPAPVAQPAPVPAPATTATPAPAPRPKDMAFASLTYDYAKDVPEACLRFTLPLDPNGATTYRDSLALRPNAQVSLRVADNALCLAGLDYGRDYTLTIRQGLAAADGTKVAEDENLTLSLAEKEPYVGIVGTGFILPREGAAGVPVETINVDKVAVHVLRVSDRNLAREARTLLGNTLNSSWALKRFAGESATLIWKGEMAVERKPNQRVVTAFPLASALKDRRPGAYLVVVSHDAKLDLGSVRKAQLVSTDDDEEYYEGEDYDYAAERRAKIAARMVVETDIALTSFGGRDGLHAFARSLETGKPVAGVELALISTANEELARPATDAAGHVQFAAGLMRGLGGAAPAALMAFTKAGDFALLDLRRPAFDLSDRGVSGRPTPGPIDAFLYPDRGIYRPGETVNLMALIRDQQVQGATGLPITLSVARPNGVELRRFVQQPDAAGGIPLSFVLPDTAPRGMWSVTAFVDPKGAAVGRVEFDVQDFVPQRLKVTAGLAVKSLAPGDTVELTADAMFLYGAPAAELTTEAEIRLVPDRDPFPEQKGWKFGRDDDPFVEEVVPMAVEPTDEQGHTVARGMLKRLDAVSVPLKAQASVSVFEPSGRFVADRVTVPFRNRDVLLGLRPAFADGRVSENSDANFELAAFDAAGQRIARRDLRVRFYYEWTEYTWFNDQGRWSYKTTNRQRLLEERTVNVAADQALAIGRGVDWGRYRIAVEDLASGAATSYRYRGGWAPTTDAADVPDKIAVLAEKPVYGAGETAKLRLVPPMAGEALVVVATDRVWETRTISVPAEGADIEVPVKAEWGPGAYVMATWYRPLSAGRQRDPVRAVGLAWVTVDAAPRTLSVAIQAPEKVKPQSTLEVPIQVQGVAAGDAVTVTLAAVDEGILQLTRFATPDPAKHYFGKRRLAVDLRDDYGRLLDPKAGQPGQLREGGDGIGGAGLPVVPTKSVALFAGPVAVDAQGRATIKLEVPDFVGQLRLMAVAYGKAKVGNGEGKVIVRHPLVADASFPRFLAPRDKSQMTLLVHNVEGAAGTYKLNVAATGAVRVAQNPGERTLGVNERKLEALPLEAVAAGIGTVTLDVSGPDGLAFKREWQIAVRSAHLPITLEQVASQADGAAFIIDPDVLAPFEAGTAKVALNYSAIRGIDVGGLLQSLERYPYGCTEQQVSRAYPLVSAKDLGAVSRALNGQDEKLIRKNAQASVDIILDRQDETGAIGLYRAGDGAAWPWVQVQAVEFLIRAKEAGYVVPDRAVALGYAYLENIAKGSGGDYRYNRNSDSAAGALAERAYALSVLARAGRGDIGEARQLHDRGLGSMRGALGPALLGGALADLGDKGRSVSAFRYALTQVGQAAGLYDYYGSALRDVAGALALAVESNQGAEREALFAELVKRQKTPERATTQEKLWLSRAALSMLREGELTMQAGGVQPVAARGVLSFAPGEREIAQGYSVTNRSGREAYRTLIVQGAPREAPPALNAGFEVKKSYFSLSGEPLDPAEVKQHDRIMVSIEARATKGEYRQAVLVDPLPAGWEIEAVVQRYEEDKSPFPWLEEVSSARVREVRDDRFVAAVDLGTPPRAFWYDDRANDIIHVAYVVRAVTPGEYVLPATVVEDMYRPGTMGRTATGRTRVSGR